ncbi:hypothetical protein J5X98_00425 [Leptothermofonsia sichuanensis E412]|uniref:hypothetical protein n=1 Tax=Leptothermofonsia sichuanensis TaxID=2917832 RepID=UPI001CA67AC9|nr:hypothetical protein [Leptothermofonsia sichuanensis]QZZ21017.1 hypothetical protein J5X98_00425 [Leptothermofonsia sichuanensis E412]
MKGVSADGSHPLLSTQLATSPQPNTLNRYIPVPAEYCLLCIPVSLAVGILSYRRYRAWIFRKRVETLEKLWKLNIPQKPSNP